MSRPSTTSSPEQWIRRVRSFAQQLHTADVLTGDELPVSKRCPEVGCAACFAEDVQDAVMRAGARSALQISALADDIAAMDYNLQEVGFRRACLCLWCKCALSCTHHMHVTAAKSCEAQFTLPLAYTQGVCVLLYPGFRQLCLMSRCQMRRRCG